MGEPVSEDPGCTWQPAGRCIVTGVLSLTVARTGRMLDSKSGPSVRPDDRQQGTGARRGAGIVSKPVVGSCLLQLLAADHEAPLEAEDLVLLSQAALLTAGKRRARIFWRAPTRPSRAAETRSPPHGAHSGWASPRCSAANSPRRRLALAGEPRCSRASPTAWKTDTCCCPPAIRPFTRATRDGAGDLRAGRRIGERFGEKDLVTLGLQGQGRALSGREKSREGGAAGRGHGRGDRRRGLAAERGRGLLQRARGLRRNLRLAACAGVDVALERWCASQPDLVPYRGHCLVRRAELLQLHGAWAEALEWAQRAAEWLSRPMPEAGTGCGLLPDGRNPPAAGKFADAEEAYRPGEPMVLEVRDRELAQLRLAQGRVEAATRRSAASEEVREPAASRQGSGRVRRNRSRRQRYRERRAAAEELAKIADGRRFRSYAPWPARSFGGGAARRRKSARGLAGTRRSWNLWCDLEAPYEARGCGC